MRRLSILVVSIFAWTLAAPGYAAELIVSDASGRPGDTVTISVSVNQEGDEVQNTLNDIHFDPLIQIFAGTNRRPDCVGVDQQPYDDWQLGASFIPQGCTPGVDCTGMRAVYDNSRSNSLLDDGAHIYTCNVTIDANAVPGDYSMACDRTILSRYDLTKVENAGCKSGIITVLPPPPPELIVSDANGHPGETVTITVSLNAEGDQVQGTQNDLHFNPPLQIRAGINGRPDCVGIQQEPDDWVFFALFRPQACMPGVDCNGLRAYFIQYETPTVDSADVLSDGAVLYTCNVTIGATATPGDYPLTCDGTIMGRRDGTKVQNASCHSGTVTVLPPICSGDCNSDGQVTIDELITGINIAQEIVPLDACAAMDINGDGAVTIEELVVAYNNALYGCGGK